MAKGITEPGSFSSKDYHDPPPAPLIDPAELTQWSFYRALIAEFIATLLFLYITVLTVIGYKSQTDPSLKNSDSCGGVGILGIAWAFGGMIFVLVYCTAGISGELRFSFSFLLFSPLLSLFFSNGKWFLGIFYYFSSYSVFNKEYLEVFVISSNFLGKQTNRLLFSLVHFALSLTNIITVYLKLDKQKDLPFNLEKGKNKEQKAFSL